MSLSCLLCEYYCRHAQILNALLLGPACLHYSKSSTFLPSAPAFVRLHRKGRQVADEIVADIQVRQRGQLAQALQAMQHVAAKHQIAQTGCRCKLLRFAFLLLF